MNKTALVTGAARNIGKGIARSLLIDGYDCVLVDRDKAELARVSHDFAQLGGRIHQYVADIGELKQVDKLMLWIETEGISVTELINNAGYESESSVSKLTEGEMAKSFDVNLQGPFYLTSLVANNWIESHIQGNIIFISSTHSKIIRTHPLYSASKAAIEMFMREAALEFAPYGIRINSIAPGAVQDTDQLKTDYRTPLGYYMQPQDIAEGISFLLSNKARFITGQSLIIDGGYSLTHTHHWIKQGKLQKPGN